MEAMKKAASGAVDSIRNSPLFRRKFGTRSSPSQSPSEARCHPGAITPEKDPTPFVQGVYFHVNYLGKKSVDSYEAQDHGCTDEAVALLWSNSRDSPLAKLVSIKITTTSLRVKEVSRPKEEDQVAEDGGVARDALNSVLYEFPLFSVSYCGTNPDIEEAFSFVAKDSDGKFYCYVFRCTSKDKSYALALAVAKAFYLAYQILLEQQGNFPAGPERELLFEPQLPDDTLQHPLRPVIELTQPQEKVLDVTDAAPSPGSSVTSPASVPYFRVSLPSQTSMDSETLALASVDADFARLAKARSNPDILRSTLDSAHITGGNQVWSEALRLHADPGSSLPTPIGSVEQLNEFSDSS